MTAELLELPQITPDYLNLGRFLTSRQSEYPLSIAEHQGSLTISAYKSPMALDYQLILDINGEQVSIALEKQAIRFLLPGKLDFQAIVTLPSDLLMAALHYHFTPTLQQFSQLFGASINLIALEKSQGKGNSEAGLNLFFQLDGQVCTAQVGLEPMVYQLLNQLPRKPFERLDNLPIWGSMELGRTLLSATEIRLLETGDIVFLEQYVTGQHLIIRLNSQLAFLGEAEDSHITIQQRIAPMEQETEQEQTQPPEEGEELQESAQEGIDLSDIAIELLFEVGRQEFSASEVEQMQPGYTFELDRPIEQPVRIRANGKIIAECQLVQIENRLGAKIIELKS